MKRLIIIAMVASVVGVVFGALTLNGNDASAAKEKPLFVGKWEAIDVLDGSYMQMSISPGLKIKLVDDWASTCPAGGAATYAAKGDLLDPFYLEAYGQVRCKVGHERWGQAIWFEALDPDLLTDEWGNIWTRMP
jgi:hypothetical protein